MRVRLLKTVLDEEATVFLPGSIVDAEWRDGRMWVSRASFLCLNWDEWEAVVPDTMPEDKIPEGG